MLKLPVIRVRSLGVAIIGCNRGVICSLRVLQIVIMNRSYGNEFNDLTREKGKLRITDQYAHKFMYSYVLFFTESLIPRVLILAHSKLSFLALSVFLSFQ